MSLHLGTGSWADAAYKTLLTAPGVPAKERLRAYSAWFDHVEVNASYYATPRASAVEAWVAQTPPRFTFNIKLLRAFSQNPHRAAAEGDLVQQLLEGVRPLVEARRLGCFLLVLPPSFKPGRHRLTELDALAAKLAPHPLAVELRDRAWVEGAQRAETLGCFKKNRLAWVAVDMPRIPGSALMPAVDEVTRDDLAYLRLHGRNPRYLEVESAAEKHDYAYPDTEIADIAQRVRALSQRAKDVHVIANNHAHDFAPKTALALRQLLSGAR